MVKEDGFGLAEPTFLSTPTSGNLVAPTTGLKRTAYISSYGYIGCDHERAVA